MSVLSYARFMLGITAVSLPILSTAADSANSIVPKADATTTLATENIPQDLRHAVQEIPATEAGNDDRPVCIALLMPSDNSPFLAAAKIVENGLLAANHAENNKASILLIESPEQLSIDEQIDAAIYAGADVIVGPLQKDKVEELAQKTDLIIPTVALNVSKVKDMASTNLLMLSISMEDEARQLAEKAVAGLFPTEKGERPKVIVLKSEDPWAAKLALIYEEVLRHHQIEYSTETVTIDTLTDLKTKLEPELSTKDQEYFKTLYKELKEETDAKKIKFKKRQIHNELRTHIAETEPPYQSALLAMDATMASLVRNRLHVRMGVWATSTTNPGDTDSSPTAKALAYDLNELRFVESPLVLNYDAESFTAKFGMEIPYTLPAKRLFALGADAYTIANIWASAKPRFEVIGETGSLSVDRAMTPDVLRTPVTAIINNGSVVHPAPELPVVALPEPNEEVIAATEETTNLPPVSATHDTSVADTNILPQLPTYR